MTLPNTPVTRRKMLAGAVALGASLLTWRESVSHPATPATPTGWEAHTGAPDKVSVTWDPARWMALSLPDPDRDIVWLIDPESGPEAEADPYLLAASHEALPWLGVAEAEANALDYRFPTRKPDVLGTWTTADATGFASMGGDASDPGFNYLEFSALETEGMWRSLVFSIPVKAFDSDRMLALYRAVEVDDQPVPRAVALEALAEAFDWYAHTEG